MSDQERLRGDAVSTHSRPKAAGLSLPLVSCCLAVSTHSRPKAAGRQGAYQVAAGVVSTHSRPKAAGTASNVNALQQAFQLTAARRRLVSKKLLIQIPKRVSTHSRPKAAGCSHPALPCRCRVSTHSRPKAAGQFVIIQFDFCGFQLTAARRRLASNPCW